MASFSPESIPDVADVREGLVNRLERWRVPLLAGLAIAVLGSLGLVNFIVDGELLQTASGTAPWATDPEDYDRLSPNDNLIEGNTFEDVGGLINTCTRAPTVACENNAACGANGPCLIKVVNQTHAAIQVSARTQHAVARKNVIRGGWAVGMSSGGVSTRSAVAGVVSGRCTAEAEPKTRFCVTDADCAIPGFPDLGECEGAVDGTADAKTRNTVFEDNLILGGVRGGIHFGQTIDPTARGNVVIGPNIGIGINLTQDAFLGGTVTRNTFTDVSHGIGLTPGNGVGAGGAPPSFALVLTRNDFTGMTNAAVLLSAGYTLSVLPSELSDLVLERGNYWGLTCDEGGFDPNEVLPSAINDRAIDSFPFGVPVAHLDDAELPLACPLQ